MLFEFFNRSVAFKPVEWAESCVADGCLGWLISASHLSHINWSKK